MITTIELACSVGGRNSLYRILENFLPIMSYWVCPWFVIGLEEHLIFHELKNVAFDWTTWDDRKRLPIGLAASVAWLAGWASAVIGMAQIWYKGPIALKVGDGANIGAWLAIGFTCITYPPLRWLELKLLRR